MNEPWFYEIRIEGRLTGRWSDWFDGMAISNEPGGAMLLCGQLADQAALFGVLNKIQAFNLTLISVKRVSMAPPSTRRAQKD